ncbi:MAG: 2-dehydro-3-deoxygalactonokinase [Clostridia bacterium]|nr:2-dehydro-3-deoxygalactonokinase [Clostridia bacterium]
MAYYITVDGGTTNTRIYLVRDEKVVDSAKFNIGAMGGKSALSEVLKGGIAKILNDNNLVEGDIERVLLSGMITSEYGLCELPHAVVPTNSADLKKSSKEVRFEEISNIPFVFIPGVKTDCQELETSDMMRGEETEVMGLASIYGGDAAYLLPGSHSKLITLEKGKITSIKTMMTGEMIAALSQNTILKDSVNLNSEEYDSNFLLMGYDYAEKLGINEALFKTRILKNLFSAAEKQTYAYFLGVMLYNEIQTIISSKVEKVVIGGRSVLKKALAEIISAKSNVSVTIATDLDVMNSTSLGAVKIYETK